MLRSLLPLPLLPLLAPIPPLLPLLLLLPPCGTSRLSSLEIRPQQAAVCWLQHGVAQSTSMDRPHSATTTPQ
jgi:hypothetical protein